MRGDWLAIADLPLQRTCHPMDTSQNICVSWGNAWAAKSEYENAVKDYTTSLPSTRMQVRYRTFSMIAHWRTSTLAGMPKRSKISVSARSRSNAWDVHHARLAWLVATYPDAGLRR